MRSNCRAGTVRPERDSIGAQYPVEVDETLVGGRTRGEARGVHHKAIVVGAVEVRPRSLDADGKKRKKALYAGSLRLCLAPNCGAKTLTGFVQENVAEGAVVRTDGWDGYDGLAKLGYTHEPMVLDGDGEKTDAHLPMIHIAFSNLKTGLLGTHHGVRQQQRWLRKSEQRYKWKLRASSRADAGLGIEAAARAKGLGFVALTDERYHLVCLKSALDTPPVQALRAALQSDTWQRVVNELPGYNAAQAKSGEVVSLRALLPWWRYPGTG